MAVRCSPATTSSARRGPLNDQPRQRGRGVWRWHEILPVRDWSNVVTLGEGSTPLLEAPRLGDAYGIGRLLVKAESLNPTGSFKARGMTVAVSRAKELGATSFVMPSAGNAGGALAAYAGVAGVHATVVMPSDAPVVNQVEVAACGADLILVDGLISDCGRLTARIAERTGAFNLSTLKEPYRVEGKKTMGIELAEDLGWSLPDVIVYPMGGGTGLIGMWKAFAELEAMGLLGAARPRMVGVQVEGCAPLVRAFLAGKQFAEPWADATTEAAGLRVPSTVGDFLILEAINASGGTAIAVPEAELAPTQAFAARHGAGFLSLESAAVFASLPELRSQGAIGPGDTVVVFDTGAGFKSTLPETAAATNRERERRRLGAAAQQLRASLSYVVLVHATRSSGCIVLMTMSAETPHAAARSHPRSCHSS